MRSTFKTLFYINRQKTKADGNTAILCRITIDGKSTAISTGEECNPSEWNTKQGLTTNRKTNQRINEFRELIEKTYRDILTREGVVSVELIKNRLQGIATNPTTLLAMSKAELQSVKESVGKSRAEGTYLNLYYSNRNLREFIENKGVQDICHHYGEFVRGIPLLPEKAWAESIDCQYQSLLAEPTDVSCGEQEDYPLQSA